MSWPQLQMSIRERYYTSEIRSGMFTFETAMATAVATASTVLRAWRSMGQATWLAGKLWDTLQWDDLGRAAITQKHMG
jgi:hypothetical protein